MFRPRMLTVMTTDQCTAKCDHCSVRSDKDRSDRLTLDQMIEGIRQTYELGNLRTVVFAGGEPTMLKDDLNEAIAYAFGLGLNTRLVTNASWAITPDKAMRKVEDLRASGLLEINISFDKYHSPYIPPIFVKHAWDASRGQGFGSVVIATHYSNDPDTSFERVFNLIGEELPILHIADQGASSDLHRREDGTIYALSTGPLQKIGRAAETISDQSFHWFPLEGLEIGCKFFADSPALSPRNTLLSCCGVEANRNPELDFGKLESNRSVSGVLEELDRDLMKSSFAVLGPVGLARLARKIDPDSGVNDHYTSVCHVCEHITNNPKIMSVLRNNRQKVARAMVHPESI